jgi:hypothetical protein
MTKELLGDRFGNLDFVLLSSFVIRISDFVILSAGGLAPNKFGG